MGFTRRDFLALAGVGTLAGIAGCTKPEQKPAEDPGNGPQDSQVDLEEFKDLALNEGAWRYDEDNDVYYQLGLAYCKSPATKTYESLAVFVPGKYFSAEKNGDTYRCTVDEKAVVGGFTPSTAPILMPVNTGTLSPQTSPTAYSYDGLAPFMQAGCIYVYAGFRGRSAGYDTASGKNELYPGGSPWPAVDLKAAVRYLRYNAGCLPCDASRVFVFGFAAGGGVSAVLGSSGNSALYAPYLESIGAATHDAKGAALSDAVFGSASWCPITSFDEANAAYEWAMGQYSAEGTRAEGAWTRRLSQDLAGAYGDYVNEMDLRLSDDTQLTLDVTDGDAYALGAALASNSRVASVTVSEALQDIVDNTMKSLDYIVGLVVVCACALALVVLFNLCNISITERVREIATVKVLGFYHRETLNYVFREILLLTFCGALVGLPAGWALHRFIMQNIRISLVSFHIHVTPLSYALAFAATLLLAVAVCLCLIRKIDRISMAESLKSIE